VTVVHDWRANRIRNLSRPQTLRSLSVSLAETILATPVAATLARNWLSMKQGKLYHLVERNYTFDGKELHVRPVRSAITPPPLSINLRNTVVLKIDCQTFLCLSGIGMAIAHGRSTFLNFKLEMHISDRQLECDYRRGALLGSSVSALPCLPQTGILRERA
jgi:hypothetical protein